MTSLRSILFALASLPLLLGCSSLPTKKDSSLSVVQNYLAALNRRDLLMLTAYVEPNVVWHSVVNGERIQEVAGREALAESLRSYFAQNEHTEWRVEQATITAQVVAVRERSSWGSSAAHDERTSLAVYELHDGRIARITHFLIAN